MFSPKNQRFLKTAVLFLVALSAIFLFFPKKALAATFTFTGAPVKIQEDAPFSVTVNLEGLTAGNNYYLRAVFSHPDTLTSYFGYTKNNSANWYNGTPSPINHTQFFRVTMDAEKSWSGLVEIKPDPEATAYKGPGKYNLKIGRYTEAGSGPTWTSESVEIEIEATPGVTSTPEPTPEPTDVPSGIILSEYMPNPEDDNEWIEIRNTSSSQAVLTDWHLDDVVDGGSVSREFSVIIGANGFAKIDLGSGFLNNAGDEVSLLYPDGSIADKTYFPSSDAGVSWMKSDSVWCQAESPTPGASNSSCRSGTELDDDQDDSDESEPTPTPTPTPTPVPTKKPTPSPTPTPTPTPTGQVLGEEDKGVYLLASPTPTPEEEKGEKDEGKALPVVFLISGMVFLFSGGSYLWYTRMSQ